MAKRQFAIFFLDTNKAYFYGSNVSSALQMEIPADILSYWDILSRDKFYQLIQTLVTGNKIEPVPLLIILAPSATVEMDVPANKPSEEVNSDIEQFLDAIAYEKVMSRTYKIQDKSKVVAANRDLYEAIKHGFEKFNFTTVGVVSLPLLQKVMPEIGNTLNFDVLAGKFDTMKQYSLVTADEVSSISKSSSEQQESEKPNPLRLYGLVGVFAVLLIVLGYMVYTTMQSTPKPVVKRPVVVVTPLPTALPTAIPAAREGTHSGQILSPTPRLTTAPEIRK